MLEKTYEEIKSYGFTPGLAAVNLMQLLTNVEDRRQVYSFIKQEMLRGNNGA